MMKNCLKLIETSKVWDKGIHNGFTDLIEFKNSFFLCFRTGKSHSGDIESGYITILQSKDKQNWTHVAKIKKAGVDLRDPHFSIMPDGRLMLTLGGSIYINGSYESCIPQVAFSKDGIQWSLPLDISLPNEWIWRLIWHKNIGYGFSYCLSNPKNNKLPWILTLFKTNDGISYLPVKEFHFRNHPSEATIRFLDDKMVVLLRRRGNAWIGHSTSPYTDWKWQNAGHYIGGGNFVILPEGQFIAGGRTFPKKKDIKISDGFTSIGRMTFRQYYPELKLPSKGDNSYPGMIYKDGILYVSYYSSHEGKACIYLAKILVSKAS